MMLAKVWIVVAASVLICEAAIEIPGLENFIKCRRPDEQCVNLNKNKVTKAISRPLAKYSFRGYDPLILAAFTLIRPEYQITQTFDYLEVYGLGDTKTISTTLGMENGVNIVTEICEHTFKVSGSAKFNFYVQPHKVSHEGPFSAEIVALRSTFVFPYKYNTKNGEEYLDIGKERLVAVDMPNLPNIYVRQLVPFVSDPAIISIVKKIRNRPYDFHKALFERVIEDFGPLYFQEKRKFYNNVPLSDLLIMDSRK